MARSVSWIILSYVLQLHVLLQLICIHAALEKAASMPSLLPHKTHAESLPRLLKLDISPSSPPATPSTPPPPPRRVRLPPPPPPPSATISWLQAPPPPCRSCGSMTSPPPPSPSLSSSTSYADTSGRSSYSYTAIVALPVLAVVMIFICSFMLSHNQQLIRGAGQGRAGRNSAGAGDARALQQILATGAAAGGRQGNCKGLDRVLLSRLPTLLFTTEKRSAKGDVREEYAYACAVCIGDFEEGEMMRLLPACGHTFHKDCIDMWLFSHSTCPLCRLGLFSNNGELILKKEKADRAPEWQRGAHLAVDAGPSASSAPLDRQFLSPLINIFRRSQSLIDLSHADVARTPGLAALRRSSSQPMRYSKVHPTHSFRVN